MHTWHVGAKSELVAWQGEWEILHEGHTGLLACMRGGSRGHRVMIWGSRELWVILLIKRDGAWHVKLAADLKGCKEPWCIVNSVHVRCEVCHSNLLNVDLLARCCLLSLKPAHLCALSEKAATGVVTSHFWHFLLACPGLRGLNLQELQSVTS